MGRSSPFRGEGIAGLKLPPPQGISSTFPVVFRPSSWRWASAKSARPPLGRGAHKGTGFDPIKFKPDAAGTVSFCGCKRSAKAPRCNGSHKSL